MDAITVVALAGDILQFVQFVGGLLGDARKLYASATGTSGTSDHLQSICDSLIRFDAQLQEPPATRAGPTGRVSSHSVPLAACAAACRRDCEDLLSVIDQLKVLGTKRTRRWSSFRVALAEVRKKSEIEGLRSRIADRQRQMTLLMCAASAESIHVLEGHVKNVGRDIWTRDTNSRLGIILAEIRLLRERIGEQTKEGPAINVSSICDGFSRLSLETRAFEKEAQVLASLNYEERPVRHEKIAAAHETTFRWGLQAGDKRAAKFGKLRHWLGADDALFWVTGKPGSGKSTFMKYVADSDETRSCLRAWAGADELLIADHYFTIYGTPIQRSLGGLLRSLLFGILARKPALIPTLLKDRWERPSEQPRWTQLELEAVLRRIGAEAEGISSKICFFIDGLDEYEGDHIDICQTLKQLSQSPSIKVCVSSRPWNVFEDALGDRPDSKLYMHELTRDDIQRYTASRLQEHPRWGILQRAQPGVPSSLVEEVVSKSSGVFLWVTLVVGLLREGLTNDDSLFDLQRRLSSFPADLKQFFKHILQTVDPFYVEMMAGTLSLVLTAGKSLPLEIFLFHDVEYADENYALKDATDPLPTDLLPTGLLPTDQSLTGSMLLRELRNTISRRINGRCKGLLERNKDHMEFLHRTVYDFLRTDEMSRFLEEKTKKSSASYNLSLLKAFLAWTKRSTFLRGPWSPEDLPMSEISSLASRLRQSLQYARLAEMQSDSAAAPTYALLENMEHSIAQMLLCGKIEMTNPWFARGIFRQLVLEAGVGKYVRRKLAADPAFFRNPYADQIRSPFYSVLTSPNRPCMLAAEDQSWIIVKLLQSGHDPHQHYKIPHSAVHLSQRPWTQIFHQNHRWHSTSQPTVFRTQSWHWAARLRALTGTNVMLALVEHGADPTLLVEISVQLSLEFELPIWLIFLLEATHAPSCEQPEAYEEVLAAMLSRCGSLGSVPVVKHIFDPEGEEGKAAAMTKCNFWHVCDRYFSLPSVASRSDGEFLVRNFARVLSKIPPGLAEFEMAEQWARAVLPADAARKLSDAVVSMRSGAGAGLSRKRRASDTQEAVSVARKRGGQELNGN